MRKLLATTALFLASCANPYSEFYHGIRDVRTQPNYEAVEGEVLVYSINDESLEREAEALIRRGYSAIGNTSFNGRSDSYSEAQVRRQAEAIGAHVVLVMSHYSHTITGVAPITVPSTTTSYSQGTATAQGPGGPVTAHGTGTTTTYGSQTAMVPYSIARSDFGALFFAKTRSRLRVLAEPVDDDTRRKLQTNAGIMVRVVIEKTPAFAADVLPGDVILAIGDDSIQSVEDFLALIDKYQGTKPNFKINRDGTLIEKEIDILTYELSGSEQRLPQ